ncbi:MAG: putative photosynthetic complex assembly protein PuhE [Pseudomonadota bacterium]
MTLVAISAALFLWWFFTGAILFAVARRRDVEGCRRAVILSVPLLSLGVAGGVVTLGDTSVFGAYAAFVSALCIWGWFEMAFLAGVITGAETLPGHPDLAPRERFQRAFAAIQYSEIALVICATLLALASIGAENRLALMTFMVLFVARICAKLNVHFGVPNINDEFLPAPVRHLTTHFRHGPMNAFFPWSVTFLTLATGAFAERAWTAAAGSGAETGYALLATLTALALFEHWMMVLPIPDAALWRWILPSPGRGISNAQPPSRKQRRHGF